MVNARRHPGIASRIAHGSKADLVTVVLTALLAAVLAVGPATAQDPAESAAAPDADAGQDDGAGDDAVEKNPEEKAAEEKAAAKFAAATEVAVDGKVDAWGRDPDSLSGQIGKVCGPAPDHNASAERPGRVAMIAWLAEAFPEVQGFSGFVCREIHNPRTSCPGREAPRRSDCWSTHAAGRAIDVITGGPGDQDGLPVGKELGDRIVNLFLERVNGVDNYRARVMGVQQLLWDGRCWSTRDHAGKGIIDINDLDDDCVNLHDNHVHITLSEAGADGLTSFFSGKVDPAVGDPREAVAVEPAGDPRDAHLLAYDAETGRVLLRGVAEDGTFTDLEGGDELEPGWTTLATPDVAGNGDDELFAYDKADGDFVLHEIRSNGSLGTELSGGVTLEPGWSLAATPDVDGDGDDELLLYRGEDGAWALYELRETGALGPQLQVEDATLDVFFSHVATPDLDGDGDDELLLYRQFDGHHVVRDFADADALDDEEAGDDEEAEDEAAEDEAAEDEAAEDEDGGEATDDRAANVDFSPFEITPALDTTDDGDVDATVDLVALDPLVVDLDGAPIEPDVRADLEQAADDADEDGDADVSSDDSIDAPPEPLNEPGLGTSLTAGFTSLSAIDVDADGIDELALYRAADGCMAIRELARPIVVVDPDAEPVDGQVATVLPTEPVQPCLGLSPAPDEAEDDSDDQSTDVGEAQELDPSTWLLESPEALEPGWSGLMGTAID